MGDLDTCLITEFAKRPGFYDRGSPYFKDKIYTENAWKEIAIELGYEVTMLKERMYQLRNRYNLEKRKLETMRTDELPYPKSTWTLFYHLTFLDGHIRPRKSYKSMMRKAYEEQEQRELKIKSGIPIRRRGRPRKTTVVTYAEDGEDDNAVTNGCGIGSGSNNGLNGNPIKHEVMSESEEDVNTATEETFLNPANLLAAESSSKLETTEINKTLSTPTPVTTTTTITTTASTTDNLNNQNVQRTPLRSKRKNDDFCEDETEKLHRKSDKFTAFGQFITASLSDLPEQKALDLIEKFTVQLVSSMRGNLE